MAIDTHEKAVNLTEQALEKLVDGDQKAAEKLIAQAKKLDPEAPAEVVWDIDEDTVHRRAYELWEESGRPEGKHQEHWDRAIDELRGKS